MKKIAVIDYGMSNLHSVIKAFQKVVDKNYKLYISNSSNDLDNSSIIVLPGQGAARSCMDKLKNNYPDLKNHILNKPFMGICLGFQILFDQSNEDGGVDCLSIIEGNVEGFRDNIKNGMKVPHMGWNRVIKKKQCTLWNNISDDTFFYFVHSYYGQAKIKKNECSVSSYGTNFTSSVIKDNIFACQFHPEKSSKDGLQLISNFISWADSQ